MPLFRPATRLTARTTTTRTFVTSGKILKDNKTKMESAGETLKQAGQAFKNIRGTSDLGPMKVIMYGRALGVYLDEGSRFIWLALSSIGRGSCDRSVGNLKPLGSSATSRASDGAVGKQFEADGNIGQVGEAVGGPFSSKGAIGKEFTDSGSVGGTVEKAATDTKQKGEEVKRTPT
ncbi:hypothetical protein JCM24511_01888 [Saitozyma sp. JCM 24511]|nr:hypothetical protein JCM24511_01888 [Saitozyma sp. JCM 24511]